MVRVGVQSSAWLCRVQVEIEVVVSARKERVAFRGRGGHCSGHRVLEADEVLAIWFAEHDLEELITGVAERVHEVLDSSGLELEEQRVVILVPHLHLCDVLAEEVEALLDGVWHILVDLLLRVAVSPGLAVDRLGVPLDVALLEAPLGAGRGRSLLVVGMLGLEHDVADDLALQRHAALQLARLPLLLLLVVPRAPRRGVAPDSVGHLVRVQARVQQHLRRLE
mmetsp:Transcript_24721/g.37638  ORF Transcript_24721/g.37638 Transcript_24721/m.37638 type:complete len:223 (-) Transcript_24721:747-1415(-)